MKFFLFIINLIFLVSIGFTQTGWNTQASGTNKFLTDIYFTDSDNGWITGWTGTILRTEDGGANWTDQNAPPTNGYNAVHFIDNSTGWAVGYAGRIVHTTDGGSNWNIQTSGTKYSLSDLYFINADTGWAVGGKPRTFTDPIREILYTSDGGANWSIQSIKSNREPLSRVFFIDNSIGFAVGEMSTIMRTTDGGHNWEEIMSGTGHHFTDVFFVNADTGWITAQDLSLNHYAVILKTTDGGINWNYQNFNPDESFSEIYFVNDSTGWVVGGTNTSAIIMRTTDGGNNWVLQSSNTDNFLTSLFFTNENNGWAAGYDGTIIHTESGGIITSLDPEVLSNRIPEEAILYDNYPNPFNPTTTIRFNLVKDSYVKLTIQNMLGQEVADLTAENLSAGMYEYKWNASDYSSGLYYYNLKVGDRYMKTKKLILLR